MSASSQNRRKKLKKSFFWGGRNEDVKTVEEQKGMKNNERAHTLANT